MRKRLLLVLLILIISTPLAFADIFMIDPTHSQINFTVPHLMIFKLRGVFTDYSGTIKADPDSATIQSISATIRTASIDTREEERDEHLRGADFFDVKNYPEITFTDSRIVDDGSGPVIYGALTIRDTTRTVALRGKYLGIKTDPWGKVRAGFEGTTTVNRQDFGLVWNQTLESNGVVIGDQVEIGLEIQAIKPK